LEREEWRARSHLRFLELEPRLAFVRDGLRGQPLLPERQEGKQSRVST